MKKILFLIHDLGEGGAEKVMLNLVNNMDQNQFDITVMTLFDYGVNRQFISPHIKYKTWCKKMFRGNAHFLKIFTPQQLHKMIIKEKYDIEIAYLEGPCARVISGCDDDKTKKIAWIHTEQHVSKKDLFSFRSVDEAKKCYNSFDRIICVSEVVKKCFAKALEIKVPVDVLYNTNETERIIELSKECIEDNIFVETEINLIGVGKLLKIKGFDRLISCVMKLKEDNFPVHLYILGIGPMETELKQYVKNNRLNNNITFLGYKTNPYKYMAKSDLFVCSSYIEGFSTAATEALIVGTPVCTVDVSGMKEMLGDNSEYGIIVENNEEALYRGMKKILSDKQLFEFYKTQSIIRGKMFSKENTVKAVENMLLEM